MLAPLNMVTHETDDLVLDYYSLVNVISRYVI